MRRRISACESSGAAATASAASAEVHTLAELPGPLSNPARGVQCGDGFFGFSVFR
jgi:hypothetical protein